MKKLTATDGSDGYVLHGNIEPLQKRINQLIDEVEEIKIQLLRIKKDRSDPRSKSHYDLSRRKK